MRELMLGSIAHIEMGQSPPSYEVNQNMNGIPFIQGNGEFGPHHPLPENWCTKPAKIALPGDVLISVRAPVGAVNVADQKICIGRGLAAIRLRGANPQYGLHAIRHLAPSLRKVAQGTTFEAIGSKELRELLLPGPDETEQKRIAEILDEVDRQIEAVQIQMGKERNILEGLTYDLYLEHYDHKSTNSIRIGKPKKSWPIKPLQEVAQVERGKFTHRPRNDARCYGGVYPFIQTGDVGASSGRRIKSFSQTLSSFGRSVSKEFPKNTVAITIAANIGDTCILDIPMCFPDSVVGIQVNPNFLIPEFLETFLRLHKLFFESRAPQSAQKNINLQDLFPLPTLLPSLEEQTRIANTLGQISNGIDELEEKKSKLLSLKKGLLTKLIGGTDAGPQ